MAEVGQTAWSPAAVVIKGEAQTQAMGCSCQHRLGGAPGPGSAVPAKGVAIMGSSAFAARGRTTAAALVGTNCTATFAAKITSMPAFAATIFSAQSAPHSAGRRLPKKDSVGTAPAALPAKRKD